MNRVEHTVFLYYCRAHGYYTAYLDNSHTCPECGAVATYHTATLDPAMWIACLLNASTAERRRMIEECEA